MFSPGPGRMPMPPYSASRRRPNQRRQAQAKGGLLSLLQTSEGNLDFAKITATAKQINTLYGHISPMISRFMKK